MAPRFPPVLLGFLLLVLLPALIGAVNVSMGVQIPYNTQLTLWTQPWIFAAALVLFAFFVDVRQGNAPWLGLSRIDVLAIFALVGLSLAHRQFSGINTAQADIQMVRLLFAIGLGMAAYYGMWRYQARFAEAIYLALLIGLISLAPLLFVYAYFQTPNPPPDVLFKWQLPGFGAVRLLGMALEVGVVVAVGMLAEPKSRKLSVFLWVSAITLWAVLFWTGGRGAVVSVMGAVVVLSVIRPRQLQRIWSVLLLSGAVGAALSMLLWVPPDTSFGILNMFEKSTRAGADAISNGRLDRWLGAVDLIKDRVWVGHGLGQFSQLWPRFIEFDAALDGASTLPPYFVAYRTVHNLVLEAFLAWGIVGGLIFMGLMLKAWMIAIQRARLGAAAVRIPAFLGVNVLLLHSLFAGVYAVPHGLFYLALLFGICLAPNLAQKGNTKG